MNLVQETKFILKKYGISANKSLGQNFLINEEVVEQIIEKASISKEDFVIEIGPGLGTLTSQLLEKAGKVMAVELDDKMIDILTDRFHFYQNFELVHQDVLKVDLETLVKENVKEGIKHAKIVANLPYYITTPIIMKLLEEKLPIESITVMIQKEVADRLIELPGGKKGGAITYAVYYYAEAQEVLKVPPTSFIPEPSVESKVIQLHIRKEPPIQVQNETIMFELIKYAFMQRRKTAVNALEKSNIFHSKNEIIHIFQKCGLNEKIRGEALSLEDFANIENFVTKM